MGPQEPEGPRRTAHPRKSTFARGHWIIVGVSAGIVLAGIGTAALLLTGKNNDKTRHERPDIMSSAQRTSRTEETRIATKEYCLKIEKVCLQVPTTWEAMYTTDDGGYTNLPLEKVVFREPKGEPVLQLEHQMNASGMLCNPADSMKARYGKPVKTVFTQPTSERWKEQTVSKYAFSLDGGTTWQWRLAGPKYLHNPASSYAASGESESDALNPVFDTELTLTGCAAAFKGNDVVVRAESKVVNSMGAPLNFVISSGRCLTTPACQTTTFGSAAEALADPKLEAAVKAVASAKYP